MKKYCLIGSSLHHSFSKSYFDEKFRREGIKDCTYELVELPAITGIRDFLIHGGFAGANVTIPYKLGVLPFLDALSSDARAIGAVNTIRVARSTLEGFNTDWQGFMKSLEGFVEIERKNALILGTGGAAKAVAYALHSLGMPYLLVSRKEKAGVITYSDLDEKTMQNFMLIINTTPLGTFPDTTSAPSIPYQLLTPEHSIYDLVYNPAQTEFLRRGKERGAKTMNGMRMLELQAELSWDVWNSAVANPVLNKNPAPKPL